MDGTNDLAAIDALQVDAGDPKVRVAIMRVIVSREVSVDRDRDGDDSGGEAQAAGCSESAGVDERGVDEAGVKKDSRAAVEVDDRGGGEQRVEALVSRRLMIARASRARSTGVSSWSRILGITSSPASGSSALTASNSRWRSGVSSCGRVMVSARSSSGSSNRSSNSSRSSSSSRCRSRRAASRAWWAR